MARARRIRVSGTEALELRFGLAAPLHGRTWAADVVRLIAPPSTIDLAVLEAHVYRSTCDPAARPATLLVGVTSGRLHGTADDRPFEVRPGEALFVDARQRIRTRADGPVQFVRICTEMVWGPDFSGEPDARAAPVLPDSPVLRSCLAAASALVRHAHAAPQDADDAAISSLLSGLQHALLVEAKRERGGGTGSPARSAWREQIEQYVEAHLGDPDLTPPVIAAGLGVSLRTVHGAFAGTGTTLGAFIRSRRIEEVARAAATPGWRPAEAAASFGFRDSAHMARMFRSVTGRTLGETRRGGASAPPQ